MRHRCNMCKPLPFLFIVIIDCPCYHGYSFSIVNMVKGLLNLMWDDKTLGNLAHSLFFITQNSPRTATGLSWAAQRRRPPFHCLSRSTVGKTPLSGPPSMSGYPLDVTCPATVRTARATIHFAHILSDTFRN